MIRTQVRFTEEQSRELKRLAAERRSSVAALIRQAVEALLREGPGPDVAERKRRALSVAGRFRLGLKDLSTHHDTYLAEVYKT
jgi:mRNA-degrading endonuclease RelE of RelBE toxin-antitoxin system